ncbi:unnamed protein product [Arctogadus glacialis]
MATPVPPLELMSHEFRVKVCFTALRGPSIRNSAYVSVPPPSITSWPQSFPVFTSWSNYMPEPSTRGKPPQAAEPIPEGVIRAVTAWMRQGRDALSPVAGDEQNGLCGTV